MPAEPWYRRTLAWFRRHWQTKNPRVAILRDVLVAAFVVLFLLSVIWIYTGQPLSRAPVVSVESGSMMHGPESPRPFGTPPFGRVGTIDPGDIVLVKDIDEPQDVDVAFSPSAGRTYGGHGDVIVFHPYGRTGGTAIIHRAMLYIEVNTEGCRPSVDCEYRIPAACESGFGRYVRSGEWQKYCNGSRDSFALHLERDGLFLELTNYHASRASSVAKTSIRASSPRATTTTPTTRRIV
jgi:signal peptidase I